VKIADLDKIVSSMWSKIYITGLSSVTCSQIWLNLLVDDRQTTYLTKWKGKNPGAKTSIFALNPKP
jgi:hypothetical protein